MKHYQHDCDKHILANKCHVVCDIYAAPFPRTICVCFLRVVNTPLPSPQSTRSVYKITMIAVREPTAILHNYVPINPGCVPHTTWRWQWSYSSVMDCWDCVRVLMLRCVLVAAKIRWCVIKRESERERGCTGAIKREKNTSERNFTCAPTHIVLQTLEGKNCLF